MTTDEPLPRVLEILWRDPPPARRARGLSREAIVAAAIELVEAEGLGALSMARLAERLGCGTMSLYRHVANKDELVTFMSSTAPEPPPTTDSARPPPASAATVHPRFEPTDREQNTYRQQRLDAAISSRPSRTRREPLANP